MHINGGLEIDYHSANSVFFRVGAEPFQGRARHLLVASLVAQQSASFQAISDALAKRVPTTEEWMQSIQALHQLVDAGIIEPDPEDGSAFDSLRAHHKFNAIGIGFDGAGEHLSMLKDVRRTRPYLQAIQAIVQPGDVVVEIGMGTGILSAGAAKAGARKIYAIESGSIAHVGRQFLAENTLDDRVNVIQGWSSSIELPEKADVLISEIIGNDPLHEQVLEYLRDGVRRFLKPGGRTIPESLEIFIVPARVPTEVVESLFFTPETVRHLETLYPFAFAALERACPDTIRRSFRATHLKKWAFGTPIRLGSIDLTKPEGRTTDLQVEVLIEGLDSVNAAVLSFVIHLGGGHRVSTLPDVVQDDCSWRIPALVLRNPFRDLRNKKFRARYSYQTGEAPGLALEEC